MMPFSKSRKLKIEEINLVSSYYTQNGSNAAVTGGIGSEKLTDIANVFDENHETLGAIISVNPMLAIKRNLNLVNPLYNWISPVLLTICKDLVKVSYIK